MTFKDTTGFWRAAMILHFIALIMAIIGLSVPYLITVDVVDDSKFFLGIWRARFPGFTSSVPATKVFKTLGLNEGWLFATRGLMCSACVVQLVAIVLSVGSLKPNLKSKKLSFITAGVAFLASLLGLIGINLYLKNTFDLNSGFVGVAKAGWAYFLFLFSMVGYVICGILHIVDGIKTMPSGNFQNPSDGEASS